MKGTWRMGLLLVLPLLTGCWNMEEPEDLGIVSALGIDSLPHGIFRVTMEVAHPASISKAAGGTGGGGKKEALFLVSENAPTVIQALKQASRHLGRAMLWSHARVVIIGEPLARQGFAHALDLLARGEETRREVPVVVARPTAAAILRLPPLGEDLVGNALVDQLHSARMVGLYPLTSLNLALQQIGDEGIDPFLPLAGSAQDHPSMLGSVLCRGDHMVGTATLEESRGILWLKGKIQAGTVLSAPFLSTGKQWARLGVSVRQTDRTLSGDPLAGIPLRERIAITSELTEVDDHALTLDSATMSRIEMATAQATLAQIRKGLAVACRARSDPVGFGRYLHLFHTASWNRLRHRWYRNLPGLRVQVEVTDLMSRSEMSNGTVNMPPRE